MPSSACTNIRIPGIEDTDEAYNVPNPALAVNVNTIYAVRSRAKVRSAEQQTPIFFFNDTATTEIYPLSIHDALPILNIIESARWVAPDSFAATTLPLALIVRSLYLKSTRLNSSHLVISYAVFCL